MSKQFRRQSHAYIPALSAAAIAFLTCRDDAVAGLVAHWTFNEGGGTSVANAANPLFPGTMTGGAAFTSGPAGFGAAFEGDGDTARLNTDYPGISGTSVRTVAA